MIYCANCKKPSAKTNGPCPHCGDDLLEKKMAPAAVSASAKSKTVEKKLEKQEKVSVADFDFEDVSSSGIDLAGDDYMPPDTGVRGVATTEVHANKSESQLEEIAVSPPPRPIVQIASTEIQDADIRETAGFGKPDSGAWGALKYGLKVRFRLKELEVILSESTDKVVAAEERQMDQTSILGRSGHAAGLTSDDMADLVSSAMGMDGELQGARRKKEHLRDEYNDKKTALQVAISNAEEASTPIREDETKARAILDGILTDKRRTEAKLKRAGIEYRNIKELIEKRQQEYSDLKKPKEERQRLMDDITKFDKQQPGILKRIEIHTEEIEELAGPFEEAESVYQKIADVLSVKTAEISTIRKELENLTRVFDQAETSAGEKVRSESALSQKAWARVGDRLFAEGSQGDATIKTIFEQVAAENKNTVECKRNLDIVEAAMTNYDKEIFKKGHNILIGSIAVAAIIIIGLLCWALF